MSASHDNTWHVTIAIDQDIKSGVVQLRKKLLTDLPQKRKHIQQLTECHSDHRMMFLSHFPIIEFDDESYLLQIIELEPKAIRLIPESMNNNLNFIMKCLKVNGKVFHEDTVVKLIDKSDEFMRVLNIENVVKELTIKIINKLPYQARNYIAQNETFIWKSLPLNSMILATSSRYLKTNDDLLYEALLYNRQYLRYATIRQLNNWKFIDRALNTEISIPIKTMNLSILTMCLRVARKNPTIVMEILARDTQSAKCAVRHFKTHKEIIMKAIEIDPLLISKVIKKANWFPNIRQLCKNALDQDVSIFSQLKRFKFDREIFIHASSITNIDIPNDFRPTDEMLNDRECAIQLVKQSYSFMPMIREEFQKDEQVILELCHHTDAMTHEFMNKYIPNLSTNREFLMKAASTRIRFKPVLPLACNELRHDREFIIQDVKNCGNAFEIIPEEFKLDKEIVKIYAEFHYFRLSRIPTSLLEDSDFFWELIEVRPSHILALPDSFSKDKNTLLKLIKLDIPICAIPDESLKDDDIKLALIKQGKLIR